MKTDKAWLDGLKPGDQVMTQTCSRDDRWARTREDTTVVVRRTPKRIILRYPWNDTDEWVVTAQDGTLIDGKRSGSIRPITDADRESKERAELIQVIRRWSAEDLVDRQKEVSTAKLRAVAAAIDAEDGR